MIRLVRPPRPDVLAGRAADAAQRAAARFDRGEELELESGIYGHRDVKSALRSAQNGKCAYCESKIDHIDFGDIEHYRPKLGFRPTDSDPLDTRAYYWLAYEWTNLLFTCTLCNQAWKKNVFPLADESKRATDRSLSLEAECPLLLDPYVDDPGQHLAFDRESPRPLTARGEATVRIAGLDREALTERRRTLVRFLDLLVELLRMQPVHPDAQQLKAELLDDSAEYAAVVRSYFASPRATPPPALL